MNPQECRRTGHVSDDSLARPPLSTGRKAAWASAGVSENLLGSGFTSLALPVYNIILGVNPALISMGMAIPRLLDAFIDPFIGNVSDNARTRWGRRRPFILVGGILSSVLFALMWMPPRMSGEGMLFAYFLVMAFSFYLAYSVFVIPYNAMGYELSYDYHERTGIGAWKSFFNAIAGLGVQWLYWLSLQPLWGGDSRTGVMRVGIAVGLVALLAILPAVFYSRSQCETPRQPRIRMLGALRSAWTNRPFRILLATSLLVIIGFGCVGPFALYILIYHVSGGDQTEGAKWAGVFGTAFSLATFPMLPVITRVSRRFGKKATLIGASVISAGASLASLVLFSREHPWLVVASGLLVAPAGSCIWILLSSMTADCCDEDEMTSGARQEGLYGAIYAFVTKLCASGVTVLTGLLLVISGFHAGETPDESVVMRLRLMYAIVPAVLLFGAAITAAFYPISEARLRDIRAHLDERRRANSGLSDSP